jgi:hypothetical protein
MHQKKRNIFKQIIDMKISKLLILLLAILVIFASAKKCYLKSLK